MANSSNKYCDVATATGSLNTQSIGNLVTEGFSKDWGLWSSHCQGSTVVSKWTWCLRESCRSTSWPSTSLASWSCWCPGSPSGWTTRRCQPGWPWGWPPCWPCQPPRPAYRTPFPLWPTPRPSTSGPESASSSSLVPSLNMPLSTMPPGKEQRFQLLGPYFPQTIVRQIFRVGSVTFQFQIFHTQKVKLRQMKV